MFLEYTRLKLKIASLNVYSALTLPSATWVPTIVFEVLCVLIREKKHERQLLNAHLLMFNAWIVYRYNEMVSCCVDYKLIVVVASVKHKMEISRTLLIDDRYSLHMDVMQSDVYR
ncbi:hypothetical protein KIN20_024294 [Parelaphostrongylus tenuis]|uniref:Uncharacterized protein n=1 Tax=Parelaphostrongylus tenuis TaxID=148309 RepID=A0AAD5NCR0_PARTN|nr:hypothetical protein KIN20_024294 [Parelaphostrongylus tenuis]